MTDIKLKRVYDEYSDEDGLRVLVDRLWPRGVRKDELHFDIWAKEITPSNELRKWVHEDKEKRWSGFCKLYREELIGSDSLNLFVERIKGYETVTLLYAAKDVVRNHALVLKAILEEQLEKK